MKLRPLLLLSCLFLLGCTSNVPKNTSTGDSIQAMNFWSPKDEKCGASAQTLKSYQFDKVQFDKFVKTTPNAFPTQLWFSGLELSFDMTKQTEEQANQSTHRYLKIDNLSPNHYYKGTNDGQILYLSIFENQVAGLLVFNDSGYKLVPSADKVCYDLSLLWAR